MLHDTIYFVKAAMFSLRRLRRVHDGVISSQKSFRGTPSARERQKYRCGYIINWRHDEFTVRLRQRTFASTLEGTRNHQQQTLEGDSYRPLPEPNLVHTVSKSTTHSEGRQQHRILSQSMVPLSQLVRAILTDVQIGQLSNADIKSILTEAYELTRPSMKQFTNKANIAYTEKLVHRLIQEVKSRHFVHVVMNKAAKHESTTIQTSHAPEIRSLEVIWQCVIVGGSYLPVIQSQSKTASDQGTADLSHTVSEQPFITTGRLLMKMLQLHHQHPSLHPPPTAALYDAWLYSCCRCSLVSDDAVYTAEAILRSLERNTDPDEVAGNSQINKSSFDVLPPPTNVPKPTTRMYNHVVLMHANRARTEYGAAAKAEDVLMRMTKAGTHPSTGTFNRVLLAWSQGPEKEGGNRAADILRLMWRLSDDSSNIAHGNEIAPDEVSFGTVISAFARRDQPEACQLILEDAITYFASDSKRSSHMANLHQCWNYVLFGWARSGRPDAPERVEAIMNDGIAIHDQIYKVVPTRKTYVACIEAHLKSGRSDRIDKAERYLHIMVESMRRAKDNNISGSVNVDDAILTTREFDTLIYAWFRSLDELENIGIHKDAGMHPVGYTSTKASTLLFQMLQLQEEGYLACAPSSKSFHLCIESLCRTGGACINATKWVKKVLKSNDSSNENLQLALVCKTSMKKYAMSAADRALEILDMAEKRKLSVDSSYAALIPFLCRFKDPRYTYTAAEVLKRYEQNTDERNLTWQHNKVWMYQTIVEALNEIGTLHAAELALAILRRIPKFGKRAIDMNCIAVYSGVLSAFAKHPSERSFVVAMELFNKLVVAPKDNAESKNSIDISFCERVLWTLAESCSQQSAGDTCAVLNSIFDLYSSKEINFHPSISCFDACIHALTKFPDLKYTSDSVLLLKLIVIKYEDGSLPQVPSKTAFDLVIRNCIELGTVEMLQHAKDVTLIAEKYGYTDNL